MFLASEDPNMKFSMISFKLSKLNKRSLQSCTACLYIQYILGYHHACIRNKRASDIKLIGVGLLPMGAHLYGMLY